MPGLDEGHWQRIQVSNLEKQLPYKGHLIPIAPYLFMYCNIYKNRNSKSEGQKTHTYILYFLFTFDMCSGIHPAQPPTTVPSGSVTVASSEAIQGSGCLFIAGVEDASSQATTLIMGQVLVPGMGHVGLESSLF